MARLRAARKRDCVCRTCGKDAKAGQVYCAECLSDMRADKADRERKRRESGACPRCGEQKLFLALSRGRKICLSEACLAVLYRHHSRKTGDASPSQAEAISSFVGSFLWLGRRIAQCLDKQPEKLR